MKVLFTFYVPSGGIETLNRLRGHALRLVGMKIHLLYAQYGAGLQNKSNIPTFVASSDMDIQTLLGDHKYDAIMVSSDFVMLERLRRFGYSEPIIYEAQGLGAPEQAEQAASLAAPYIQRYAQGIHLPPTAHLIHLFKRLCPQVPQYVFSNVVDYERFHYTKNANIPAGPVICWVGRLERNKNWKAFIDIGHRLIQHNPRIQLWMFLDKNLSQEQEYKRFAHRVGSLKLEPHLTVYNNIPHDKMKHYLSITGDSGGFLLSTSILEGFGYSVAEALSCRCPVLCTDSDGVKVFITHNITGKFYTHDNLDQAVQEGLELMSNSALRLLIRKNGEAHMKKHFQPSVYAQHFSHMLNQVKSKVY